MGSQASGGFPGRPSGPYRWSRRGRTLAGARHSDKAEILFGRQRAERTSFVRMDVETARRATDFQVDDEGSIPFTRSGVSIYEAGLEAFASDHLVARVYTAMRALEPTRKAGAGQASAYPPRRGLTAQIS
jgi:hypothetical protein